MVSRCAQVAAPPIATRCDSIGVTYPYDLEWHFDDRHEPWKIFTALQLNQSSEYFAFVQERLAPWERRLVGIPARVYAEVIEGQHLKVPATFLPSIAVSCREALWETAGQSAQIVFLIARAETKVKKAMEDKRSSITATWRAACIQILYDAFESILEERMSKISCNRRNALLRLAISEARKSS